MIRRLATLASLCASVFLTAGAPRISAQTRAASDTVTPKSVVHDTTTATHDTVVAKHDTTARDSLARHDSLTGRDSTRHDSTAKPLVTWADSDSVVAALMSRPGYRATRYQGNQVIFNAPERILHIVGTPAAVGRDQTLVVGDTVIYNDSTKIVIALGDTVILRDPSQQTADVYARGRVTYNVEQRRGLVTNITTSVESGERYYIGGKSAAFVSDTSKAKQSAFYVHNGIITSCDDTVPDYYIKGTEIKYISKNLIAVRPATLYIAGVPVFWLPFFFQDVRLGRRSGLLRPNFGLSEFVRNSPSYRRHIRNLGYYADLGNYMDAQVSLDWRSGARGTEADPGYIEYNGQFRYNWLDHFINGTIAASRTLQRDGSRNTAVSWTHSQEFSQTSRFVSSVNFVTNTTIQRQTAFDPQAVLSTIRSDASYTRQVGPFSVDLGGTRTQYPGRSEIDESYPNVSVTSPALALTKWLDWTPSFNYSRQATVHSDAVQSIAYRYFTQNGLPDSSQISGSTNNSSFSLNTPFTIKGFQITAGISAQSQQSNFPVLRTFVDSADTALRVNRMYSNSYLDGVDWTFGFGLPSFLNNSLHVSPSISFDNVLGGSYWVRSELSHGMYVHQSKRISGGVSISPTLFGLFPGFGPFSRIRHSITPSLEFRYAPAGHVDEQYLAALNQTSTGFLGNLAQEQMVLNLSQVFEAKMKSDTSDNGKKIKLLSINTSPLTYDFERARATHRTESGFTTSEFSYNLTTDLLPGFTFESSYSLFQGDVNSDSSRFSPFRDEISTSFTLNGQSGLGGMISRLLGHPPSQVQQGQQPVQNPLDSLAAKTMTSLPVAGSYANDRQFQVPDVTSWTSSISFSSRRQRPPVGGNVLTYNPATYCSQYNNDTLQTLYLQCQQQVLLNPQTTLANTDPIAGGVFVRVPPTETIQAQSTFHITDKWSVNWNTMYDAVNHAFASQQVTLQRDLHDWRAIFSFTSSPNGNFFFSVLIANKAQPQLSLPYDKATYRQQAAP